MADEKRSFSKHSINVSRREIAVVTGVIDVISFDDETVITDTELGSLVIRGVNLHVSRLNLENGELEIDGDIASVTYEDQSAFGKGGGSFFNKLFK
ncbi:MAG: sporulation protein YabP [Clostridiales bacterium]|jgi:sporulation protein YabP|nr:sporulation protein YabP [Clostridiales bacterium]